MTYIFVILIFFFIYCVTKSFFSKYSWLFTATIWSLIGLMYISFLLTSLKGNYSSVGYILGTYDIKMFMRLISNKIHYFTLIRMYNILSCVYFFASTVLACCYITPPKKVLNKNWIYLLSVIIFCSIYMYFYEPDTTLNFYTMCLEINNEFYTTICIIDILLHICVYTVLIVPIILIIKKFKRLITIYNKKQIIGICLFIVLIHIMFIILTRISDVRNLYFPHTVDYMINPRSYSFNLKHKYLIYVLLMFIIMLTNFYVTAKFNIIKNDGIIKSFINKQKRKTMNKNFLQVFHGVKNVLLVHKTLLDSARKASGDEKEEILENLSDKMEGYISRVSSMLDSINLVQYEFLGEEIYVSDVLNDVLKRIKIPSNVVVKRCYKEQNEKIFADTFYFSDAIYNVIDNAICAAQNSSSKTKEVTISVENEFSWIVISVSDTGNGMTRKTKRQIFEPFFSTKSRINNWGIGMYFTKNIINQHNGNISLQSRKGKGTTFFISMPNTVYK